MDKFKIGDLVRIADVESTRNPRRTERFLSPGHTGQVVNLLDRKDKQLVIIVLEDALEQGRFTFDEYELDVA